MGLLPLAATTFFEPSAGDRAPEAAAKIEWLLRNRPEMTRSIHPFGRPGHGGRFLLSVLDGERLRRVLQVIRDPVDQRDGDHGTWRRPIRPAEPISRIPYEFLTGSARPTGHETCGRLARSVGGEVGFVMVRTSPRMSWTRDA